VTSWYESRIDRAIREAQERGEFDDLPGLGKRLPDDYAEYDEQWWIRGLAKRESLVAALPPALALRREVEDLPAVVAKKSSEAAVRATVVDLNERILRARRGPVDGPPVSMNTVDVEHVVRLWRATQQGRSAGGKTA
jgi:Domain of unknown function (DUF1992)